MYNFKRTGCVVGVVTCKDEEQNEDSSQTDHRYVGRGINMSIKY